MKVHEYKGVLKSGFLPSVKETNTTCNIDGRRAFTNPEDIAGFMLYEVGLSDCSDEFVYVLCLNTKCKLIGLFEASHGSTNRSSFPVREILQKSLMIGSTNIIIVHNHPSGDCSPSEGDINATKRIIDAGKIIDLPVLDHIIVGGNVYFSFMENNMFEVMQ